MTQCGKRGHEHQTAGSDAVPHLSTLTNNRRGKIETLRIHFLIPLLHSTLNRFVYYVYIALYKSRRPKTPRGYAFPLACATTECAWAARGNFYTVRQQSAATDRSKRTGSSPAPCEHRREEQRARVKCGQQTRVFREIAGNGVRKEGNQRVRTICHRWNTAIQAHTHTHTHPFKVEYNARSRSLLLCSKRQCSTTQRSRVRVVVCSVLCRTNPFSHRRIW